MFFIHTARKRNTEAVMEWHALILSILLLSVVSIEARSLENVCSRSCESSGVRKFFAKDYYEYTYTYQADVESSFYTAATENQKASLNIHAPFSIKTSSDCNLVLQINRGVYFDNQRPESSDELEWQRAVTERPLYFTWENGIVKQVCPSVDEPTWVVNFKKGILSALQSSADETATGVKEVDVSGSCEADYFVEGSSHNVIRKTKDYSTCENRNDHLLFSWSMPYEFDSLRQSYIQSHQVCQQTVGDVLQRVECNEDHTFRPFSTDESGAKTTISQTINFVNQRRLRSFDVEEFAMRKTDLQQETETDSSSDSMEKKTIAAKELLSEICSNMDGESYDRVSKQFISLVSSVRQLDSESLTELSEHVNTCRDYRSALNQMLASTLPFCGTEACVTFASSLIQRGELENEVAELWLAGFGWIKEPTVGMITSVLELVESNKYPQQSYLSIGSMIHQFCENEDNCMNNGQIRQALEILELHLGSNCHSVNMDNRVLTLLALRALGNAGHSTSISTLKNCISETRNSLEVRIAATDAFRRMSCGTDRSGLLSTLENESEDSELRIAAYRNLMLCPTDRILMKVRDLLEREKNMQVGSYIWSHLNEVKESQDPLKIFFSKLLQPYEFTKFDLDQRKYSRYYEATVFSDNLNSGGSADASIVWSPKSFIPRSISSNVTIHMFGQAINLFEISGRIEGAESYLQSILEPSNYEKRQQSQELVAADSKRSRLGREIPRGKPHVSGFLRVFGKELIYMNNEMVEAQNSEAADYWSDALSKFMSTDGYSYHDDTLLLDTAHTLPTGLGMPLYLSFTGSSSVDLRAKGKFDLLRGAVNGKFTPRAAITISGSMIVDSNLRKTGIATESTGYTSTSVSGSVKITNNGQNFAIELDSPYEKNMAMKFNHKLLKVHGGTKEPMGVADTGAVSCTEQYLGQRICHSNSFNEDSSASCIFPSSGEVEISGYLEKMDAGLTKYTISGTRKARYENDDDMIPNTVFYQLDFDTPGSNENRKAMVMSSYSIPDKQISMIVQKGDEVSRMQGFVVSNEDSKVLELSADLNGDLYSFKTNFERMFSDEAKQMTGEIVLQTPDVVRNAEASLVYRPMESLIANFEMNNVLPTPVVMKVDLKDLTGGASKMTFSGDIEVALQPYINSKLIVDVELNPEWNNMGFSLNYKFGDGPKESITFHQKRSYQERDEGSTYQIDHLLSSTQFTLLNSKVLASHAYTAGSIASTLDASFGARMLEENNPYSIKCRQEYSDKSNSTATVLDGHVMLSMPFLHVNRELTGSYVNGERVFSANIKGTSGDREHYSKFMWENIPSESNLLQQSVNFELYSALIGKWQFTNMLSESPRNIYSMNTALSLGATDELQFFQDVVVVNLPTNKTVSFNLRKGGENNGIFSGNSVTIFGPEMSYSKNLIHVFGFEPRGLNVYSKAIPQGRSASIEFLKSNVVSVGAEFVSKNTDTGRHYTTSVMQHNVEQRTLSLKFGYDFIVSKLMECYLELAEGKSDIVSTKFKYNVLADGTKHGNVSVIAKEHSSLSFSSGINFYTTVDAVIGSASSFDIVHRNNDDRLIMHVQAMQTGIQGSLDQTYFAQIQPVSYSAQRTGNGAELKLWDRNDNQAVLEVTKGENKLALTWTNAMPTLRESVPTNAALTIKMTSDGMVVTSNMDEKRFDASFRSKWPKINEFDLTNSICTFLPGKLHWRASYKKSIALFEASVNSQTVDFKLNHASDDKFLLTFNSDSEILKNFYIPESLSISHNTANDGTQTQSFSVSLSEKSIQMETEVSSGNRVISFNSNGLEPLPKSGSINVESSFSDSEFNVDCNVNIEETPYKLSLSGLHTFSPQSTNFPYVNQAGTGQVRLNLLKNSESQFDISSTITIQQETLKNEFSLVQSIFENIPQNMNKVQQLTYGENSRYGALFESTIDGSKSGIEVSFTPQRLELAQNLLQNIPEDLVVTYEFGNEMGNVRVVSGKSEDNLAFFEYDLSENNYRIRMEHHIECVSEFLSELIEFQTKVTNGNVYTTQYTWGDKSGSSVFTNNYPASMTLHCKDDLSPISEMDISYNLGEGSFEYLISLSTDALLLNHSFSYDMSKENNMLQATAGIGYKDIGISFEEFSIDVVSLNEISFTKRTTDSIQPMYSPKKYTLTWAADENTFSAQISDPTASPSDSHTIASLSISFLRNNYQLTVSATDGTQIRTATASLEWDIDETSLSFDASVSNGFEMINFKNAGASLVGKLVNAELDGTLNLKWNGKTSEDKLNVMWGETKHIIYTFSQDITELIPASEALKLEEITNGYKLELAHEDLITVYQVTKTDAEIRLSVESSQNGNFVIVITKSPITVSITQTMVSLEEILPRKLIISSNIDTMNAENIVFNVNADDQSNQLRINRRMNGELTEYSFTHDFSLPQLPSVISLSYRISPYELYITWGESEAAFKQNENGFVLRQNLIDNLPKHISATVISAEHSLSAVTQEFEVTVDQYNFNHQLSYKRDMNSVSISESLKHNETPLLEAGLSSTINVKSGNQKVVFKQSINEEMTQSFGYGFEYILEESAGSVSVSYGVENPTTIETTFSTNHENTVQLHLEHNISEIASIIPKTSDVEATMTTTGQTVTYSANFQSGEIEKVVSLSVKPQIEQLILDLSFMHDFEQLQEYVPTFNASFDLMSNGKDITAAVAYKLGEHDKHAKVHVSIEENDFLISIDQKLFEETPSYWRNRRRHSQIPDKYVLHFSKSGNDYSSQVAFRMGPKRRYFNVTLSNSGSQPRTVWKMKIDQNLNKLLPTKLPASSVIKFMMDSTDYSISLDVDDMEGSLQVTVDQQRSAIVFSQNFIDAVPSLLKMEVKNFGIDENSLHVESGFSLNEYGIDSTVDVTFSSPALSITGTQEGLDKYMASEFFFRSSVSIAEKSLRFESNHNIEILKSVGYPKAIIFAAETSCGEQPNNLVDTSLSLQLDGQRFTNTFKVNLADKAFEIISEGVRPESYKSTNAVPYSGKFSLSWSSNEYSIEIAMQEGIVNNSFAVSLDSTNKFDLKIANDDSIVTLVIDKDAKNQVTFAHNVEILKFAPQKLVIGVNPEAYSMTIQTEVQNIAISFDLQPRSIHAAYAVNDDDIFSITAQFSTHPAYQASATLKIVPLEIDTTGEFKAYFFQPDNGKSEIEITLKNNRLDEGIHSLAYAYLNDKGIWDTTGRLLVESTITDAAFKFDTMFVLHDSPYQCHINITYDDYYLKFDMGLKNLDFSYLLPKTLAVYEFNYGSSVQKSGNQGVTTTIIGWNEVKKIEIKNTVIADSTFVFKYEVFQVFVEPHSVSFEMNYAEEQDWTIFTTKVAEGNGKFFQYISKLKQIDEHSVKYINEIRQTYYEFGNITVTTALSGDTKTFVNMNLTVAQSGEEILTFTEEVSVENNELNTLVTWTQHFTDNLPAEFRGTLRVQYSATSLSVHSDVQHNANSDYFLQQFTTTGEMTFSPMEYNSEWKMTTGGRDIIVFNKGFSISESGLIASMKWMHPYKQLITPSLDTALNVKIDMPSITITSETTYEESDGTESTLIAESNIFSAGLIYAEDSKITKNGDDILVMNSAFRITPYDLYIQAGWKQSIRESIMPHFNISMNIHLATDSLTVTTDIAHSAQNSILPPQFTINGDISKTDSSVVSDWKATGPDRQTYALSKLSLESTKTGHEITLTKNLNLDQIQFNIDATITTSNSNHLDLRVIIDHSFNSKFIPSRFTTTGQMTVGNMLYNSVWKITSDGQDLVTLIKKVKLAEDDATILLDWKQPYEEFFLKSLMISSDFERDDSHFNLVNILSLNNAKTWKLSYNHVSSDLYNRKYVYTFADDTDVYKYTSTMSTNARRTEFKLIEEVVIPETSILAMYMPGTSAIELSFVKGSTNNITAVVTSSKLQNPHVAEILYSLHKGSQLFKGAFAVKRSPADLPGMDAQVGVIVDTTTGVTVSYNLPPMGLDHQITVRYDQREKVVMIEFVRNQESPITFTVKLGKVIPTIRKAISDLRKSEILPEMKPIAYIDYSNGVDVVLGVKVQHIPYTLHFAVGPDTQQPSFSIFTKRRDAVLDQILQVTARVVEMDSVQIELEINEGFGKYLNYAMGSSVAEIKDKVTVISNAMIDVLRSFDNFVEGSPRVQSMVDAKRNEMIRKITEVKASILEFLTDMHTNSVEMLKTQEGSTKSGLFKVINTLSVSIQRLQDIIRQPWLDLKKSLLIDISEQISSEIKPMLQFVADQLKKFNAGQLFLELVDEGVTKFIFALDKNMEALLRSSETPLAEFLTITENRIVVKIPLSFQVKDTLAPPSWSDIELWLFQSAFAQEVKEKIRLLDRALEMYNQFNAIMNMPIDEILPPFKGHAEISGFRHVRTFDGKRYNYKSACGSKHTLLRDTKYYDFVVLATFGATPSITVSVNDPEHGQQTVNLLSDYSVTDERNRPIAIPSEYASMIVKRNGDQVTVETNYGLVVTCNFLSEICTFDISPFYFAQVDGMLGTFNNEPNDDFTGKGQVLMRNSEELAQSWMESQSTICSGDNDMQRCDLVSDEQCNQLFESEKSIFSACFAIEDPTPYKLMCAKDTCSSASSDNGVCRAYSAYARRCALRGVNLPTPSACKKCNTVSSSPFHSNIQVPVTGADVIYVIERADCLRFRKKDYKKMVGEVHSALSQTQANGNINYAVVGFGGLDSLAQPHTVPFRNNIYVESNADSLTSDQERSLVNALRIGAKSSGGSDILEALAFASDIPMRAGAARTIILITCVDCSDESTVPLDTVRERLVDQGIVLHHMRQSNIQAGRTSKKVIGFNRDDIFSKSSTMPRSELKVPANDQCLPLADLTGGSMWNSVIVGKDNWGVLAKEIGRGVDSTTLQDCICGVTAGGSNTAKCTDSMSRR